jgi:hypothetical protein
MFICQLYGTIIGGLINYWVLQVIIQAKRPYLDGTMDDPSGQVSLFDFSFFLLTRNSRESKLINATFFFENNSGQGLIRKFLMRHQ